MSAGTHNKFSRSMLLGYILGKMAATVQEDQRGANPFHSVFASIARREANALGLQAEISDANRKNLAVRADTAKDELSSKHGDKCASLFQLGLALSLVAYQRESLNNEQEAHILLAAVLCNLTDQVSVLLRAPDSEREQLIVQLITYVDANPSSVTDGNDSGRAGHATKKPRRFRVALSFAGEKREFVEEVANILARRFSPAAVLYDKFHQAEFARYDLGVYLPKLYSQESDLIVPVLCPNYSTKLWTGWEWLHIFGLLNKTHGHRVMPSRFGHATADGLSPAAGFVELDQMTAEQFATLIVDRLSLNERRPNARSSGR